MGAPDSGMTAAEQPTADALLTALRTIKPSERSRHVAVLDYWLSIRGDKEFPPLHDLDPLEISDAGPCSILLELIGGGQDAQVRHLGEDLKPHGAVERIIDAPNPSILTSIARKLPIVAISRDFLSFEENFTDAGGRLTRCWVTLLPLSSCGSWVDYVYAYVTVETSGGKAAKPAVEAPEVAETVEVAEPEEVLQEEAPVETAAAEPEPVAELPEAEAEVAPEEEAAGAEETPLAELPAVDEPEAAPEEAAAPVEAIEVGEEPESEPAPVDEPAEPKSAPGFTKLFEGLANLTGFYGQPVKLDQIDEIELSVGEPSVEEPESVELELVEPEATETPLELEEVAPESELEPEPEPEPAPEPVAAELPPEPVQPVPAMEGILQTKLAEVRALADEARQAALRATAALHEGVSAAYDFALDAESSPEDYLRLVEAQGLKIQLRAPMAPVAKLALDGLVDAATLTDAEKLLAWALKVELPRGGLLERIDHAGGMSELLREVARAG